MSVVPVSDAADRVTEDLDGRLWHVFVVVGRPRFPKVLQQPAFGNAGFDVDFVSNPGKDDQSFEDRGILLLDVRVSEQKRFTRPPE